MSPDVLVEILRLKFHEFNKLETNTYNVVAGIILEDHLTGFIECISIGSGTKSTSINNISINGCILNDCHAEVLARRGFLKYLYMQILSCLDNQGSILERKNERFKVKSNISFHFVTSESFCGDGSIVTSYSEYESDYLNGFEKLEHISEFGRTGAKCVNDSEDENQITGDITNIGMPVRKLQKVGIIRRKPGKGFPSYSMSCSDKMMRWCALGIQGVLLSLFIPQPITFRSIIIARCKRSLVAVNRAITSRLENLRTLFNMHGIEISTIPNIQFSTKSFIFMKQNDTNISSKGSIWICGNVDSNEYIIRGYRQGFTNKIPGPKKKSCISKLSLFGDFISIYKKINVNNVDHLTYERVKNQCLEENVEYSKREALFFEIHSMWLRTDQSKFYNFTTC